MNISEIYTHIPVSDMLFDIKGSKPAELGFLHQCIKHTNKKTLIIGEHDGSEGISFTVHQYTSDILCIDLKDLIKKDGSPLYELMKRDPNVKFEKIDLLHLNEDIKYDYIICINVLEHFGFLFENNLDEITHKEPINIIWNYDILAFRKIFKLLNNSESVAIFSLPVGQPIMFGDCHENGIPFGRRYDKRRITTIRNLVISNGFLIENENFIYSNDMKNWSVINEDILKPEHIAAFNPFVCNCYWLFTVRLNPLCENLI